MKDSRTTPKDDCCVSSERMTTVEAGKDEPAKRTAPRRVSQELRLLSGSTEEQRNIARLLGCTVDDTCSIHSKEVMGRLLAEASTSKDAPSIKESKGPASLTGRGGLSSKRETPPPLPCTIRGRPTVRQVSDAVIRHTLRVKDEMPSPGRTAAPPTIRRQENPYLHLQMGYSAVFASVIRLSFHHATYASSVSSSATGQVTRRDSSAEVALGGFGSITAADLPTSESVDTDAAARFMLEVLALPACRAQLQRTVWPLASSLHRSLLKRVDRLFSSDGAAASSKRSAAGVEFLQATGLASVSDLTEELFHFPSPLRRVPEPGAVPDGEPRPGGHGRPREALASTRRRAAWDGGLGLTIASELLSRRASVRFPVRSTGLVSLMGRPPTDLWSPVPSRAVTAPAAPCMRSSLWLLLCEMAQLRLLVAYLLVAECTLVEVRRAHAALRDASGGLGGGGVDWQAAHEVLRTASRVADLCSHGVRGAMMNVVKSFPREAFIEVDPMTDEDARSLSAPQLSTVGGALGSPSRYASVTQLYNDFAAALRAGQEPPSESVRSATVEGPRILGTSAEAERRPVLCCTVSPAEGKPPGCVTMTLTRSGHSVEWPLRFEKSVECIPQGQPQHVQPLRVRYHDTCPGGTASKSATENAGASAVVDRRAYRTCRRALATHPVVCSVNHQPLTTVKAATGMALGALKLVLRLAR